jgi:GNAT superfamily N-acetyltransferase
VRSLRPVSGSTPGGAAGRALPGRRPGLGGPGGLLVLGRGLAGRWEVAVEVEPGSRGHGLGRALVAAAPGLLPPGETLWAQVRRPT